MLEPFDIHMKVRFWGTRGSIPAPGPSTARYGGNTSCVELCLDDGSLIILDAGSGARPLGAALGSCEATLLLTHYHWDHIQGLPFFASAYMPDSRIQIVGPEFNGEGPEEYLSAQMMTPYFPAAPSQLRGVAGFTMTPHAPFAVGPATVTASRVCHPGVTLGYRIEHGGASVVYISDDEVDQATPAVFNSIVGLAASADILIHDCQYTEGEYASRHSWGHSTPRQAVRVAREAGVRTLVVFHHDPSHNDQQVEALADEARALAPGLTVVIGQEGATLNATGAVDRPLQRSTDSVSPSV